MSDLSLIPLQDGYETQLSQDWDGATGTVYVLATPSYTPTTSNTYIVVNPGKTNMQIAEITSYDSALKTLTVSSISFEKGLGITSSQQSHSTGSKVIISDNYQFWEDIQTSVNSKLDKNGGNSTVYATTAARDSALGADGAATLPYTNIYVTATGLFYNYNLSDAAWQSIDTGTSPGNATEASAGLVRTDVAPAGIPVALIQDNPKYDALAGTSGTPSTSNKYVTNDDTATAATADKVARRLAGGNITVVTETTGNNTTNAASTAFVQQEINILGVPFLMGAGQDTTVKTYWNFSIPFVFSTDVPTNNFWTTAGTMTISDGYAHKSITNGVDGIGSFMTKTSIFTPFASGTFDFSTTKKVIAEFGVACKAVGTEQQGFGLAPTNAPFADYDDASVDSACFTIDTAGNLYGHTSDGSGTTNHTETPITGITLTNANTYRIEFDPGVDVKFYVNGVLKANNTTHLPNSNSILFGYGFQGNSSNNDVMYVSNPYFSIEK